MKNKMMINITEFSDLYYFPLEKNHKTEASSLSCWIFIHLFLEGEVSFGGYIQ